MEPTIAGVLALITCGLAVSCVFAGSALAQPGQDEVTPVVADVIAAPHQVLADDGRRHLAYELELINRSSWTATVRRIQTLARGKVVATLSGKRLAGLMLPFGAQTQGTKLTPGRSGFVLMDASFPAAGKLPVRLTHRISIRINRKPGDSVAATRYLTAPTRVVRRPAVVVAPPLRGSNWVVFNGCCDDFTAHRGAVLGINGALHVPERFAIDFLQIDAAGRLFSGPKELLSSYGYFGAPVLAASDGRVVAKVDGLPETSLTGGLPPGIAAWKAGGNHVVVGMGGGRFSLYAHMQPGSITVNVGGRVRVGQQVGLLGNTGNTDAPHLHFHVMDTPSPLASNSLPYRFSRFTVQSALTNLPAFFDGAQAALRSPRTAGPHRGELPLDARVLSFD